MTQATESTATATLSGRELALKRRKAMALHGKTAAAKTVATRSAAVSRSGLAASQPSSPIAPTAGATASVNETALIARATAARSGGMVRPADTPVQAAAALAGRDCGCNDAAGGCKDQAVATAATINTPSSNYASAETQPAAAIRPAEAPTGRALARARRAALAQEGASGLKRVAQATKIAASKPQHDRQVSIAEGATGRQLAMQRRKLQSLSGREGVSKQSPRPAGRQRARLTLPPPTEAGVSGTLGRHKVTGTQVGRSQRTTGDEMGADRSITGTFYAQPADASGSPEKVAVSHTAHGNPITGTALGSSSRVTGDEAGACRGITGTEYLAAEQFHGMCRIQPPAHPHKVSVMRSHGDKPVSGTGVGRSSRVTGDEPGSCREITGSQYFNPRDFGEVCAATGPAKVSVMRTLSGRTVTGTEISSLAKSVADERSAGCKPVTGVDDVSASSCTPVPPPAKVVQDRTWLGQPVTGSPLGRAGRVTGDESGSCAPISGTPYIGRGQYEAYCQTDEQQAQAARVRVSATVPAGIVTGDRPGAGGSVVTGDERGACSPISGSPYVGLDNGGDKCLTSGRFLKKASRNFDVPEQPPAPRDFSIQSPARRARQREFGDVTGTAYHGMRITGPGNKANGLITGTPEFRHMGTQGLRAAQGVAQQVVPAAQRLSGEGSQEGVRVTGDAWRGQSRVTGTEGSSSQSRNSTQRGQPRGAGVSAVTFRTVERPALPESRITGSSGNTDKGAVVTLSGGARG